MKRETRKTGSQRRLVRSRSRLKGINPSMLGVECAHLVELPALKEMVHSRNSEQMLQKCIVSNNHLTRFKYSLVGNMNIHFSSHLSTFLLFPC